MICPKGKPHSHSQVSFFMSLGLLLTTLNIFSSEGSTQGLVRGLDARARATSDEQFLAILRKRLRLAGGVAAITSHEDCVDRELSGGIVYSSQVCML
jgi:hypothetical protein